MTEELLKERKEAMLALINDPTYVPMKIKELAMLLDVPREKRDELKEVLDADVFEMEMKEPYSDNYREIVVLFFYFFRFFFSPVIRYPLFFRSY